MAWSKSGCVAYITPDGYAVNVRTFKRDIDTGKWGLGEDATLDIPPEYQGCELVHVSWNHLGTDLVVTDAIGRLLIFNARFVLDRMVLMKTDASVPESEWSPIVGMHWLAIYPHEHKNTIAWSATASNDTWKFDTSSHTFNDARHPVDGLSALLYVRQCGEVRLRYQQGDSVWHEVSAETALLIHALDTFSHAAFASNGDESILLATYDGHEQLYLYQIRIKWSVPPRPNQQNKNFDKPELSITSLSTESNCSPLAPGEHGNDGSSLSDSRISAQLTHLHFLPKTPDQNDGSVPTVQAIFQTPPNVVSCDQTQPQQLPFSILVRWEVQQTQRNVLHSSLDTVTSKRKSVSSVLPQDAFTLRRLEDLVLHSTVLSFYPLWYSMTLAFIYSDGTIEFRKRRSMEVISPNFSDDNVSSLTQAGFTFAIHEPSVHVALSPNHCIAACMQPDGELKLQYMEYTYGSLASEDDNDKKHAAALAAIVLQSATAGNQYFSSDDIYAVMGPLPPKRRSFLVGLMFKGLNINVDCGMTDDSNNHFLLMRHTFFVKSLSVSHLLGLSGPSTRSLPAKVAWLTLNIKSLTQLVTTMMRVHSSPSGEKTAIRPDFVPQMVGIARWIHSCMVFLLDGLFAVGLKVREMAQADPNFKPAEITAAQLNKIIQELNSPALPILFSGFSRMMMLLWRSPLKWAHQSSHEALSKATHVELRRVYQALNLAMSDMPKDCNYILFHHIIQDIHSAVRKTYERQGIRDSADRNAIERKILLGEIPQELLAAVRYHITDYLWGKNYSNDTENGTTAPSENAPANGTDSQFQNLSDRVQATEIMFTSTTWLGLNDSAVSRAWHRQHIVDVIQKCIIRGPPSPPAPSSMSNWTSANGAAAPQGQHHSRDRSNSTSHMLGAGATPFSGLGIAGLGTSLDGNAAVGRKARDKVRACTRCGACMEDLMPGTSGYTNTQVNWLINMGKHCVCGNGWTFMEVPRSMAVVSASERETEKRTGF